MARKVTVYNAGTHAVDLPSGVIVAPMERTKVDADNAHVAALISANLLVEIPRETNNKKEVTE